MTMDFPVETPQDETLAMLLKKYGPVTVPQKDLDGFGAKAIRVTLQEGVDVEDPNAEVTFELVEA